ncbi:MAG: tRNA (adenine-N1)-methyltransferase [Chloroflexota bacterium]|nr:tRNA (adenine-N1)-methyltransferase [Chloroflexota bacterium]
MTDITPLPDAEPVAAIGDTVLLVGEDRKRTLVKLQRNGEWHTHRGIIRHEEIIDKPLGRMVVTQLGHAFLVLEPSTHDLIRYIKRETQIVFPKDAAYIVLRLNLYPGRRVIEAGTGSGGLSMALARAVMPSGRVYSYEMRNKMSRVAANNLVRFDLLRYVDLKVRDIADGFDEQHVDACFLDLREPWRYLDAVRRALKGGGFFGSLLPTTNQVSELLTALPQHGFADLDVHELLLRHYKPVAARLRPTDRMVAHTGYLVFARKVTLPEGEQWRTTDRKRYQARQTAANRENISDPGPDTESSPDSPDGE